MFLRIKKRRAIVRNTAIYAACLPVFVLIVRSISQELSLLNQEFILPEVKGHKYLIAYSFLTGCCVLTVGRLGQLFLRLLVLGIGLVLIQHLFINFSKMTLFCTFFYLVTAYYFLAFWKEETSSAFYNPQFTSHDYKESSQAILNCRLFPAKGGEIDAKITNWDENGIFCKALVKDDQRPASLKNIKRVKIDYSNKVFEQNCRVVSYDIKNRGVGVEFVKANQNKDTFGWSDLYLILEERGIVQELLV